MAQVLILCMNEWVIDAFGYRISFRHATQLERAITLSLESQGLLVVLWHQVHLSLRCRRRAYLDLLLDAPTVAAENRLTWFWQESTSLRRHGLLALYFNLRESRSPGFPCRSRCLSSRSIRSSLSQYLVLLIRLLVGLLMGWVDAISKTKRSLIIIWLLHCLISFWISCSKVTSSSSLLHFTWSGLLIFYLLRSLRQATAARTSRSLHLDFLISSIGHRRIFLFERSINRSLRRALA